MQLRHHLLLQVWARPALTMHLPDVSGALTHSAENCNLTACHVQPSANLAPRKNPCASLVMVRDPVDTGAGKPLAPHALGAGRVVFMSQATCAGNLLYHQAVLVEAVPQSQAKCTQLETSCCVTMLLSSRCDNRL